MICYTSKWKAILVHPLKNGSATKLLQTYEHFYAMLTKAGHKPQLQKLDNESSAEVEEFIATQNAMVQDMPPQNHQTNAAE